MCKARKFFHATLRGSRGGRKRNQTPSLLAPMLKQQGTSRAYIIDRLRREGMADLAEAIEAGRASAYEIACELGWQKRKPILGTGSDNEAKRRAFRLRALGF